MLQKPEVQNYLKQVFNNSDSTAINQNQLQHSNPSSNALQNVMQPSIVFQQQRQQQYQQNLVNSQLIMTQLASLADAVKTLQSNAKKNVPRPELHSNANHLQMDVSVQHPHRGIKHFVLDYKKMNVVVARINEVMVTEDIDPDKKKLMKKLNSSTNKQIVIELEDILYLFIYFFFQIF